jgi:hypothetical protein
MLGIQVLVESEVDVLFGYKVACFMVSSSSYEPNGIWHLNDFCYCIFANHEVNNNITDNACYFHPFAIRNRLWLLWQTLYRCFGREWFFVAHILGDYVHAALLINSLHSHFVQNPSWTGRCIT